MACRGVDGSFSVRPAVLVGGCSLQNRQTALTGMAKPLHFFLPTGPEARYFYVVELYETREEMCAAVRKLNPEGCRPGEVLECACLRYVVAGASKRFRALQKKHDQIGTLFFVLPELDKGQVVHELVHAAVGWAKRAEVNPLLQSDDYSACQEERFAKTVQFLYDQFFKRLHNLSSSWRKK